MTEQFMTVLLEDWGTSGSTLFAKICPCTHTCSPRMDLGHHKICLSSSDYHREQESGMRYRDEICGTISQRKCARVEESVKLWPTPIVTCTHQQHSSSSLFQSCLSKHFSVSSPALCSFSAFPFHILWVMYAFIPPNNFIHHPIRAGKLFISCPYRGKTERWERKGNGRIRKERSEKRDSKGTK